MKLKTPQQIEVLRESGRILATILESLKREVKPGIATMDLEHHARKLLKEYGAEGAFLGYHPSFLEKPYPAAVCISVNEQIVHAIPGNRILKQGDIVSLDFGVRYKGMITDAAITVPVGKISDEARDLLRITEESLYKGIEAARLGNYLGDIGAAIQKHLEKHKLSVIKALCGHGVGFAVHEEPEVLNFGKPGEGLELVPGMVLALEPMASLGSARITDSSDGFGYETLDQSLSAHFEHTIAVTKQGTEILTTLS